MRKSREDTFACVPYPVHDHSVNAASPCVQCADDRNECMLLQDQQDWNQDERNRKTHPGEFQIQEKAEWKHDEQGLNRDAIRAFRFPNLEQAAAPLIRSVLV